MPARTEENEMSTKTKTVVMIHGAWMVPASWEGFKARYEAADYTVITPAWPHLEGKTAAELRKSIDPAFGRMGLKQIVDRYEAIIRALPEKPLLVGHSFGGLIVQLLLDRGLGAAGVAIDPGPIAGVIADPISLGAALPPILRWNGWNTPFLLTQDGFNARFANTAPAALQKSAYDKYVVPAPGRIFYQAASMIGNGVDVKRRTVPLLVTAAEHDRTVAPALSRGIYNKQKKSAARTDFHEFKGVSHSLAFEPGWEKVADYSLAWAAEVL
jgi:pimeloyl-ACP methyl ester carboxylesterase